MRISDWSSDVCSSDLPRLAARQATRPSRYGALPSQGCAPYNEITMISIGYVLHVHDRGIIRGSIGRYVHHPGIKLPPKVCQMQDRSEEHTSELQSLMRISYAVFCLKKKNHETIANKQHKLTIDNWTENNI